MQPTKMSPASFDDVIVMLQEHLKAKEKTIALMVLAEYLGNEKLRRSFYYIDQLVYCLGDMPPGLYSVQYNLKRSLFEYARKHLDINQFATVTLLFHHRSCIAD